ncbi:MAG: gluconeogenesis factor YvcK family protein [Dehalococcoidia bacterium]
MRTNGEANRTTAGLMRLFVLLMRPGIGIKRWAGVGMAGVLLTALGIAFAVSVSVTTTIVDTGRTLTFGGLLTGVQRGAIFGGIGLIVSGTSAVMLYRRIAFGARYSQANRGIIESLEAHRVRSGGPRIVAIGGGTGLSSLLRGLKAYSDNITAIVTVADDGGSSGRLRTGLGIPPPGDARQCLIALSESEPLMEEVLDYRFETSEELGGHSFGNLLLAALVHTTGSFPKALQAAGELLAVRGRVMPSSVSTDVKLMARTVNGTVLEGESQIGRSGEPLESVWLDPLDAETNPDAIQAIRDADAIVMGPGSLYTSIIPNFLVPDIGPAVSASGVPRILVCNIATQPGETDGLSAADHMRAFELLSGVAVTHFLMNDHVLSIDRGHHQDPVEATREIEGFNGVVVLKDLIDESLPSRHDPKKLSSAIIELARSPVPSLDRT